MRVDMSKLSSVLFWDMDPVTVSWRDHLIWLLQRVLECGTWEDWLLIDEVISPEELRELEPVLKLEQRERNFLRNWISRHHAR
jgi:hypothetical protein